MVRPIPVWFSILMILFGLAEIVLSRNDKALHWYMDRFNRDPSNWNFQRTVFLFSGLFVLLLGLWAFSFAR